MGIAAAQTTQIRPDCDIPFVFTAAGQRSQLTGCAQNLQGVVFWHLTYQSIVFSPLSMVVETAPDNNGVPGSWSTFTPASGSNPATSTTGVLADASFFGYAPWVSVYLTSATGAGTITGHLYGCKIPGCGSNSTVNVSGTISTNVTEWDGTALGAPSNYGTSPGAVKVPGVNAFVTNPVDVQGHAGGVLDAVQGAAAPANVVQTGGAYNSSLPTIGNGDTSALQLDANGQLLADLNYLAGQALGSPSNYGTSPGAVPVQGVNAFVTNPVLGASNNSAGSSVTDFNCDKSAAISISATSGLQSIIPASAGKSVHLCNISFSNSVGVSVQIVTGTTSSTPCDTSPVNMSGAYQNVLTFALDFEPRTAPVGASGSGVCINFGGTVTSGGLVTYALLQF